MIENNFKAHSSQFIEVEGKEQNGLVTWGTRLEGMARRIKVVVL